MGAAYEPRSGCPINATIEVFGDRWSLLVSRSGPTLGVSTVKVGACMDGPGFHVEVGTLESASDGIEESVADQKGSALSHLDRAESVYGHDRLHKSMGNFCDRWSDGIDILTKDATWTWTTSSPTSAT
jgi:hypothetical protein